MRIAVAVGVVAACLAGACESAAHKGAMDDIARELELRDNGRAVEAYSRYAADNGEDPAALRLLAVETLRQGLRAPDAAARREALLAAERHDVAELFDDATALLGDDDDVVRATAAAATLRSHPDAARVLAGTLRSPMPEARAIAVAALG